MKKQWGMLATMGMIGLFGMASQVQATEKNEKLEVMTSFYPVYDFTKNVVGDEGEVQLLIPAGTEAHDYEPSAKDMTKIEQADVFVYHNENLEGWVKKAQASWKKTGPTVIKGTKDMLLLPGDEEDHDHGSGEHHTHQYDPHTWVDPNLAKQEVKAIADQLSERYPEKKAAFTQNAAAYTKKLQALDANYRTKLTGAKQKSFVTQHAAFNYLALAYGLQQESIAGVSPDQEPSPKQLATLKDYVKKHDVTYIYFEKNASNKIAKTLAAETGVKLAVLNPLESLTKEQIEKGEDYLSVMEDNLTALVKTTSQAAGKFSDENAKPKRTVANGYFRDADVKNRNLSDWQGSWRSVYPLLEKGTLDQVFDYKAKLDPTKTVAEYKSYYTTGYQTDVDQVTIDQDSIAFQVNGKTYRSRYKYAGRQTLIYQAGNRGVRYLFTATQKTPYKYVQFSDHGIAPEKAAHFHLFFGKDNHTQLLKELDHWPTYYPKKLADQTIAQEMLAH